MKNGINTGQFRVKTGSRGNGQKNPSPISVNTETKPRKYRNDWTKVEKGTGPNENFSVHFQRYQYPPSWHKKVSTAHKRPAMCALYRP
jgi:hypothetical protein